MMSASGGTPPYTLLVLPEDVRSLDRVPSSSPVIYSPCYSLSQNPSPIPPVYLYALVLSATEADSHVLHNRRVMYSTYQPELTRIVS
jgi:hypothetical protein